MVFVRGKARIRHAETGEVHEIDADELVFDASEGEERSMGPETTYSAVVHHPQLGQLVWYLWEYPVGAENDRETDVGAHELLENIDYGLGTGPPDDDDDRQSRIDALVEWFFEHYEDPAHRLPHISAEGGYQWIHGGPYDARDVLSDNFSDEPEDILEAAIDQIETDGTDWSPVPGREDYDDLERPDDADEPPGEEELSAILADLNGLIVQLPEPDADPVFRMGEDGLIHMAPPPDRHKLAKDDGVVDELRTAAADLVHSLAGTNAHTELLASAERYAAALADDPVSLSQLYGRGVRLENAATTVRVRIEADELPSFTAETDLTLNTVLDLHATFIMSQEEGRQLVENAAAYQRTPEETKALKAAAEQIAAAVTLRPDVFSPEVGAYLTDTAHDIGAGPHPERSNQIGVSTFGNLISGLLKQIGSVGGIAVGAIIGGAIAASAPGVVAIAAGAGAINGLVSFLTANAPLLLLFAAAAGSDVSWMTSIARLLDKLRHNKKT
ncbi:MAG: hypothetical protein B7X53_02025 [Hyphomonas sp. 34-62-18]|nr:hypothetical protein [Hyphomonas sp. 34-62-18]OZB18871.1 MAG: hypothetical protein B7X53_02025 [Hyphomonas sp. 34-62-18]